MGWKIFQQPINNLLDKVRKILEFGFKAHCSMNRASTKAILSFCLFVPVSNSVCAIFPPKNFILITNLQSKSKYFRFEISSFQTRV